MDTELNPYAAPRAQLVLDHEDAARTRYEFLRTEAHLKACGILVLAGGVMGIIAVVMQRRIIAREFGLSAGLLPWTQISLLSLQLAVGSGLYFLKRWAGMMAWIIMITAVLISLMQLPGSIVQLLIQAVILRFFLSESARRVFSSNYQRMILQTPEIRTRPATWVYPLIVLIMMFLVGIFWR
ncbi:hypothetical protein [Prosthecobacter vanneervenii]|uniref:Uncharacterized protein n=1 Tax=Prosthecobacter vanneervenii TaxID=48466 RepID=A0A7W7YBJ0_9BACT|nr:hypothetical protein [Prosthecobacter vanneervenii]MBB5033084.1 hypothetical protein [Prosthecobacter vanneervenii]